MENPKNPNFEIGESGMILVWKSWVIKVFLKKKNRVQLLILFFHFMHTYSLQEELHRKGGGGGRSSGGSRKSRKKRVQKDDGTYGMLIEFTLFYDKLS